MTGGWHTGHPGRCGHPCGCGAPADAPSERATVADHDRPDPTLDPVTAPLPGVLHGLTREPGRPRLTWYAAGGERVELSGHVLDNWVTKTANLLVEEFDAAPWSTVLVDLGAHWRAVVWALATWRTGAGVALTADPDHPTDVVVTADPSAHRHDQVVAVALPALARRFDGDLPPGATDAAAAVMTYGDVLTYMPDADPSAPALLGLPSTVRHGDLLGWAAGQVETTAQDRVLLATRDLDVRTLLATVLAVYAADGSLVLVDEDLDAARHETLVATERVTRVL